MAIYPSIFVLYLSHIAPRLTAGYRGTSGAGIVVHLRRLEPAGSGGRRRRLAWGCSCSLLSPFVVLIGLAFWQGASAHWRRSRAAGRACRLRSDFAGAVSWPVELHGLGQRLHHRPGGRRTRSATIRAPCSSPAVAGRCASTCCRWPPLARRDSRRAFLDRGMGRRRRDARRALLALAVVLAGSLNGLGMFNALMLSLHPPALRDGRGWPAAASSPDDNRNGVPWVSVLALFASAGRSLWSLSFERLISIDLVLYGAALVLEFVALVVLRLREPRLHRPFRVPGGIVAAIAHRHRPRFADRFALWAARDERVRASRARFRRDRRCRGASSSILRRAASSQLAYNESR